MFDDDLSSKQQRNLEAAFAPISEGRNIKILDRTAVILEMYVFPFLYYTCIVNL